MLRRERPGADMAAFRFKVIRPTFDGQPMHVHGALADDGKTVRLWATDHASGVTMDATVTVRPPAARGGGTALYSRGTSGR